MALATESWYIFRRNFRIWIGQPMLLIPTILLSIFIFLVWGSSLRAAVGIPGFPTADYNDYFTPMILIQTLIFASGDAGYALLTDMLSGYFDKLLLAPIHRFSILMGLLLMTGVRMLVMTGIMIIIATIIGVQFQGGFLGILVIVLICSTFGVAWSCISIIIALKTKSAQATQSAFVLFFPPIFLTTGFMPKDLLPDWFQVAVTVNPVNYVLEAVRAITIVGWDWTPILQGVFILLGLTAVLMGLATWMFRRATA